MKDQKFALTTVNEATEIVEALEGESGSFEGGSRLPYANYKLSKDLAQFSIPPTEEEKEEASLTGDELSVKVVPAIKFIPVYIAKKKALFPPKDASGNISNSAPLCLSMDSVYPSPDISSPINPTCNGCPKNVWREKTPPECKNGVVIVGIDMTEALKGNKGDMSKAKPFIIFLSATSIKNVKFLEQDLAKPINGKKVTMHQRLVTMKADKVTSPNVYSIAKFHVNETMLLPTDMVKVVKQLHDEAVELLCRKEPAVSVTHSVAVSDSGEPIEVTIESENICKDLV